MDIRALLQEIARLSPDRFKVARDFVMNRNDPAQPEADSVRQSNYVHLIYLESQYCMDLY